MELHDFVAETLKQIITGVSEALELAKEKHASINPYGAKFLSSANCISGDRLVIHQGQ